MAEQKGYEVNQPPLYRLTSPTRLFRVLGIDAELAEMLLAADENYIKFTEKKTGRPVEWPKPKLRAAHKRIANLLCRIVTPEFLHSAVRGKSYISNAAAHSADSRSVKIDIRKFFPSTRAQQVFHFFRDKMECAPDVAGVLTKLLTVDGHLATGSSASPILSYFAYWPAAGSVDTRLS